jgi:hypothetical protein
VNAELPTREDINVHNSLDEQHACKVFFGKTLDQAELLFRENALFYSEDLMWMGAVAFQYYVQAFVQYIQSHESERDADATNCFVRLLEFRFEHEPQAIRPIARELSKACRHIIENYESYQIDPEIYGNLCPRCEQLIGQLASG